MEKVTKDGRVFNAERELSKFKLNGKWAVRLDGKNVYVHRLMWEHFIGSIPHYGYIIFKDFNPDNLTLDNLKFVNNFEMQMTVKDKSHDFPYVTTFNRKERIGYRFVYKGKYFFSSDSEETLESFYRDRVLSKLSELVEDITVNYTDNLVVHTNSRVYSSKNISGVIYNKNTGRWIFPNEFNMISLPGTRKSVHAPTFVWNLLYPFDKAELADFRVSASYRYFDLVKVK